MNGSCMSKKSLFLSLSLSLSLSLLILCDVINRHGGDADSPTAESTKQSYEGNTAM